MNNNTEEPKNIDFDYWMKLAINDPDEFEAQRQKEIQEIIASAPDNLKKRLEGLQWQIDTEIKLANTPMEACIKVNEMLMKKVYGKNGFLDILTGQVDVNSNRFNKQSVLDFGRHHHAKKMRDK